jgi:hypothetical protein
MYTVTLKFKDTDKVLDEIALGTLGVSSAFACDNFRLNNGTKLGVVDDLTFVRQCFLSKFADVDVEVKETTNERGTKHYPEEN